VACTGTSAAMTMIDSSALPSELGWKAMTATTEQTTVLSSPNTTRAMAELNGASAASTSANPSDAHHLPTSVSPEPTPSPESATPSQASTSGTMACLSRNGFNLGLTGR